MGVYGAARVNARGSAVSWTSCKSNHGREVSAVTHSGAHALVNEIHSSKQTHQLLTPKWLAEDVKWIGVGFPASLLRKVKNHILSRRSNYAWFHFWNDYLKKILLKWTQAFLAPGSHLSPELFISLVTNIPFLWMLDGALSPGVLDSSKQVSRDL